MAKRHRIDLTVNVTPMRHHLRERIAIDAFTANYANAAPFPECGKRHRISAFGDVNVTTAHRTIPQYRHSSRARTASAHGSSAAHVIPAHHQHRRRRRHRDPAVGRGRHADA